MPAAPLLDMLECLLLRPEQYHPIIGAARSTFWLVVEHDIRKNQSRLSEQ